MAVNSFDALSKSDWLTLVQHQLKKSSYNEIVWKVNDRISIEPYYTKDEVLSKPSLAAIGKNWSIGEAIVRVKSDVEGNKIILEALGNGVQEILITPLNLPDPNQLLTGVHPEMVAIHFELEGDIIQHPGLESWLKQVNDFIVLGSIRTETPLASPFWKNVITIPDSGTKLVDKHLAEMITRFSLACEEHKKYVSEKVILKIETGHNHLVEIAKFRAVRILLAQVLEVYGLDPANQPKIESHIMPDPDKGDLYSSMIDAAIKAIAAATGGVNRIFIHPANGQYNDPFTTRIARNVQHILQLESHMGKVADPAAGSYYLEQLTDKLSESAWDLFTEIK